MKEYLLKDAAKILNINYSTAKTILRIFRVEKRIEKKNAEEEKQLKNLVTKMLMTDKNKNDNCGDLRVQKCLDFEITYQMKFDTCLNRKDSDEIFPQKQNLFRKNFVSSATVEYSNEQAISIDKNESSKEILKNLLIKLNQNEYKNYSLIFYDFVRVVSVVDDCYKSIKTNQVMINLLIESFYKMNCNLIQIRNMSKYFYILNYF